MKLNFKRVSQTLKSTWEFIAACVFILYVLVCTFLFLMIWQPVFEVVSPITTIIFVVIGTMISFKKWTTASMAVSGLILYAASWPVNIQLGMWESTIIWSIGVLLWFSAFLRSFVKEIRVPINSSLAV